jgi:subtilisin-like proprotein convertase family protein
MKPSKHTGTIALLGLLLLTGASRVQGQITETHTFTTNRVVPDGNAAGLSEVRTLSSAIATIASVKVRLKVSGEFNGDLYGYLRHGTGFAVLLNRTGRSTTNSAGYDDSGFDVTFQTGAPSGDIHVYRDAVTPSAGSPLTGTWEPDGRNLDPAGVTHETPRTATLASFNGLDAAGEWTLYLADVESGGTNLLTSWELEITGGVYPTLAWSPADITYGAALGSGQLNATAAHAGTNVPGTFSYSPSAATVLDSGNGQPLSVTFTPTDGSSFLAVSTSLTINVAKAPLTLTANGASRGYGDSNPAFTGSFSGVQNGDSLTDNYSCSATASSSVGTYSVVPAAGGSRLTNYSVTLANGTLTVTNAPLTVAAGNASRPYGAANPAFTGTITGIKNSESITATYACGADLMSAVGTYPIVPTPGGATLANYTVTIENGTLTVGQAPLTVAADNATRVFGAPNPSFTGTITGILNSDSITATYHTAANATTPVGTYSIVPSPSGARLANYAVTTSNGSLTITAASSSALLASSANPALPGANVTFTLTLSAVSPATGTPTGYVQFSIDGSNVGSPVALSGGVATYSTTALAHGTHVVSAAYAGDGNFTGTSASLSPDQNINTPPVAGADTIERYPTQGVKVRLTTLLANDSDADGDTVSIAVAGTSANGGVLTVSGDWVFYTPAAGFTNSDSFTYTLTDSHGGSVTGTVAVAIKADNGPAQNLAVTDLGNGSFRIDGSGIPGRTYRLQYSDSMSPATWENLPGASVTANGVGAFTATDTPPGGVAERYYRAVYP